MLLGLGLSACNPASAPVEPGKQYRAYFTYDGAGDAILGISVSGATGHGIDFRTGILGKNPWNRECFGGITAAPENCTSGDYFGPHDADNPVDDPPGTYWPTNVIRPGEKVSVHVRCYAPGVQVGGFDANIPCPAGTQVHARTTDRAGNLIGDLR